jgi:hypothetical protein
MTVDSISHRRQIHAKTRGMVSHSRHWADTNSSTMSHSWPREVYITPDNNPEKLKRLAKKLDSQFFPDRTDNA